jgi:hypothetical protein
VGAYALAAHEQPRATGDIDIWVRATPENARRVWQALVRYGAPLHELEIEDISSPGMTFQMGIAPNRVDLLTDISGVTFDEAWPNRIMMNVGPVRYPVIGKADLIRNKRASARPKDLVDADNLERQ